MENEGRLIFSFSKSQTREVEIRLKSSFRDRTFLVIREVEKWDGASPGTRNREVDLSADLIDQLIEGVRKAKGVIYGEKEDNGKN